MMVCRGVLFSIDEDLAVRLREIPSDSGRVEFIQDMIESIYFEKHREWLAETDKSWDWMHRALTDGELERDNGTYPLNHVIMGGESLHAANDYIITLKTPEQVRDVAAQLPQITDELFKQRFDQIDDFEIEHSREEDFEYTWGWFTQVRDFWLRGAREGRFVLFTVDQ